MPLSEAFSAPSVTSLSTALGQTVFHPGVNVPPSRSLDLVQTLTLVLWLSCLVVGGLGFSLTYTRPKPPVAEPAPVVVETIDVETRPEVSPPTVRPAVPSAQPPPPAALEPASPAQPVAMAEPSAVAFAVPTEGPTTLVSASDASHRLSKSSSDTIGSAAAPAPETLVFGSGEGVQPAPEYPLRAMKLHQQGTVGVRLTVTPEGRVIAAAVASPSAWPMLDEAAVRTIRHRWHFPHGRMRVYDVAIRFALAE
jgi:TonB family protein